MKKNHLADAQRQKRERDEKVHTTSSLKQALKEIERLETEIEARDTLEASISCSTIRPRKGSNTSEAAAVAIASDWHIGQRIDPETVGGLNSFNAEIGVKRAQCFFQRIVSLTEKERKNASISELVLFLGGDFIDGSLHQDSLQSQDISGATDQGIVAQDLIEAGLNFLLNHGKYKQITVVAKDGNHGRVTDRQQWASRAANSFERFMYVNIAYRFPTINWLVDKSLLTHLDVLGHKVRFHHGDTISFGGINGPFTYINRALSFWDKNHGRARYTVQGHLHTHIPTHYWLVNGSLAGYNAYAESLKGEFQPPIQSFFLMDKKRGPTVQIPILVDG